MDERLKQALAQARSVRFLCSGNMVRSAYAELYARHLGCGLPVDSAGTTYRNSGLYPETRRALLGAGVARAACDAFRPRHIDDLGDELEEARDPARVLFAMTPDHLRAYRTRFGQRDRMFLHSELTGGRASIADPVMDPVPFDSAFEAVAAGVRALVVALADR